MAEIDPEPRMDGTQRDIKPMKTINRLAIFTVITIPIVISIILFIRLKNTEEELARLKAEYGLWEDTAEASIFSAVPLDESARNAEEGEFLLQVGQEDLVKVYLTFDDGPSSNTGAILDILKEYGVKATFFVTGKTDEQSRQAYRRIVDEGHTLGMHSYSHRYQEIYQTLDSFSDDLTRLQEYLYEETGVWSRYIRFPGGSSNQVSQVDMRELIVYLEEQNLIYFDWNIASGDAISGSNSAQTLADNCLKGIADKQVGIILLHDAADKGTTVEALPLIIEGILAMEHTELLSISDETIPIRHVVDTED